MYLEAKTRIPIVERSPDAGLITKHKIKILMSRTVDEYEAAGLPVPDKTDGDGLRQVVVGTANAQRLHIQLVDQSTCNLFDICDADSQIWCDLFGAFLTNGDGGEPGFYKEDFAECCTGDVLLIEDIDVDVPYKDRGVEMAIARRIIETFGAGCDLVVYWYGNQPHELALLEPLGFHKGPVDELGFFELNYAQPLVDELEDKDHHKLCRFETEETTEDREVLGEHETDPALQ